MFLVENILPVIKKRRKLVSFLLKFIIFSYIFYFISATFFLKLLYFNIAVVVNIIHLNINHFKYYFALLIIYGVFFAVVN